MEDFAKIFGALTLTIMAVVLLSLLPTALWFCFDDDVASITGIQQFGQLHWTHVWAATTFANLMFKNNTTKTAKKS